MWRVMVRNRSFFQQGWQWKGYAENKSMVTSSITSAVAAKQPPKKPSVMISLCMSAMKVWYGSL